MELNEVMEFAKKEHERQVTHHKLKGDPKTRYTMLAKLMEELGELSEAILISDSLQRSDKLQENRGQLEGEFADVLLVTLILAQELQVDARGALERKITDILARKY